MTDQTGPRVVPFERGKTEAELAKDCKTQILQHLTEICKIMDEAQKAKLTVEFTLAKNPGGENVIARFVVGRFY